MERSSGLPPKILEVLERGGTILTGNQRSARTLRLAYDRHSRALDLPHWQPPLIFAWDTWASQLWRHLQLEGAVTRLLLNPTQELHIWRSVIASDAAHFGLQSVDSLAALASNAWQLLCRYRGQSHLRDLGVSEDTRTFQRWANAFNLRCKSDGYLSPSELENALIVSRQYLPAAEILLVGFDTKTPAQTAFLETLASAGSAIAELPLLPRTNNIQQAACEDPESELTECATRILAILKANPQARIAVIHPDIASDRGEIDRTFRHTLAPELESITNTSEAPYEFSLGQPLAQSPMVAAALSILRLATGPLSIEELSRLLLSPWFTPTSELNLRAEFDAHDIRTSTLLHPQLGLNSLIRIAEHSRHRASRLGGLLRQLHSLHKSADRVFPETAKQKPYAEWADTVRDLLRAAGWATITRDSSIEFQTRRKWESALDELATLDFEGTRPTFAEAFSQLQQILSRTLFAPESRDAPIQIMSPQEAAGSTFDAIFFLSCSDLNWPPAASTNPLLGWRLQRELRMPGSEPAFDTAHARAITERIAASASSLIFSYALQTQDAHQRPSPLLAELNPTPARTLTFSAATSAIPLEDAPASNPIPLATAKVRGGSSILKNQAACPFRAFAEARLASKTLEMPAAGLDASERGSLIHATMASFWGDTQTHAALRAFAPNDRRSTIDRAITHALERATSAAGTTDPAWDPAYLEVQRERLHRVVGTWLSSELEREPFAIKSLEQKFEDLALGPITLDIRIDRIDTLIDQEGNPSGDILLDYKTGDAVIKHWQGDRPEDPQLPLYAALSERNTLAGIGFIRLRPGKGMSLAGHAAEEGLLLKSRVPDIGSLEAQIEEWAKVLLSLAEDFAAGNAAVDPKDYPGTCKFCAQRILCRVDPELINTDPADDDDSTAAVGETYG